ncbi:MAG: F0F1 ATP synthase subunit delta [Gammaproteobacteria bacterium]|nr:F0F1 ATP synthase subunit delta [Gammaproteobacteria bacterium]MBD3777584.1 F0F1 ATP synthase subunit delta [Thiotrichales bacterium]
MEFSLSTFILEVINFLILMWILKRFFYRPVLNALEKRRTSINRTLDEATQKMTEAEALQSRYQQRLQTWDAEKQQLQQDLQQELQNQRSSQLAQLQQELAAEREKSQVNQAKELEQALTHYQTLAHQQGARFAAKLLGSIASPEVEARLFDFLLQQLEQLDDAQLQRLKSACDASSHQLHIVSAYKLSETQRQTLHDRLAAFCIEPVTLQFEEDGDLLAGFRINIGAWSLRLNLHDELTSFAELDNENASV